MNDGQGDRQGRLGSGRKRTMIRILLADDHPIVR